MQEITEKMCLTVPEMAKELSIGINNAYKLVNSEGFPVIRFGERCIRIPKNALEDWLFKNCNRTF
jgi:excisionase family DNA binding protein